ncbi:unnamed protein product [Meganyctiphanes norvegica]|uniref:Reverse transcriptase domain-containing protein n=1 Tax=Meganyctiphanes norvegica TaxID=48144 RepID=A0AAV2SPG9_MEGNR
MSDSRRRQLLFYQLNPQNGNGPSLLFKSLFAQKPIPTKVSLPFGPTVRRNSRLQVNRISSPDSNRRRRSPSPVKVRRQRPIPQEVPVDPISRSHDFSKVPVGARLFRFRTVWKGASHERIIQKGLGWTWKRNPPPLKRLRQKTSSSLDVIIKELRQKRVIEKAKHLRWQSRLFTVPKKDSDKERLILDLSRLNSYINCPSFKMLTLREVKLLLPQGYWTTSIDLKDGYWHIPVTPSKRPYLGFCYRGQSWQFRAMPFGLNIAPRSFTKIISHVVRELAQLGVWVLPYLDDLLIVAPTKEICLQHTQLTLQVLKNLASLSTTRNPGWFPSRCSIG